MRTVLLRLKARRDDNSGDDGECMQMGYTHCVARYYAAMRKEVMVVMRWEMVKKRRKMREQRRRREKGREKNGIALTSSGEAKVARAEYLSTQWLNLAEQESSLFKYDQACMCSESVSYAYPLAV